MDAHYTPPAVARALVGSVLDLQPKVVADLAAGEGNLLLEAEQAWPHAKIVATDIDSTAICRLARLRPSWTVGRCDLRNPLSRARCAALRKATGRVSLLLLNPPFTCRGGSRFRIETPSGPLYTSAAMSFLLLAINYLADQGEVVAILPSGCIHNIKDAQAWRYIQARYNAHVIGQRDKTTFPGSSASTTLVRLSPLSACKQFVIRATSNSHLPEQDLRVLVIRGCCPMHKTSKQRSGPILVHYTDLRRARVHLNGHRGSGPYRCVEGPAILIPRVGRITEDKVSLLETVEPVMISDCVIALKPASLKQANAIRQRLVDHFAHFSSHYVGTGAPFITLERLRAALNSIGIGLDEP